MRTVLLLLLIGGPLAADDADQNLSVTDLQRGGFVYDKGTRLEKDARLKVSLTPLFDTLRSQAPLNVSVRVQWAGPGLLQGRILCDIYAYERYVGSWRSDEVAVNDQVLAFPLILPPSPLYDDRHPYNLRIAFETADRTILMDQRDLPVEAGWSRNYVAAIVAPKNVSRPSGFEGGSPPPPLADIFQLAAFHDNRLHASQLVTNTAPVDTRDLPLDPLRMTAFDLVILSSESLSELRLAQWQPLATWLRAGGKACIMATVPVPETLRPAWREFFNEGADEPRMTFNSEGIPEFNSGERRFRLRAGCGRVLCLTEPARVETKGWKDDLLWLYGVRETSRTSILNRGTWTIGPAPLQEAAMTFHPLVPVMRPLGELRSPLQSKEVKRVSPMTVLLLLGSCLVLIGPVDYFLLGRLGMRRLTWIFLPAVALTTTWATMRVSQASLGDRDYARSLSVADLDSGGKVARVTRLEQHYAGTEAVQKRTLTNALRVDFERPLFGWNSSSNPLVPWDGLQGGDSGSDQPPIRYDGRVTGGYEVLEPMFQWSPRLFRETVFGEDPRVDSQAVGRIDWKAIDSVDWSTVDGRLKLVQLVQQHLPEAKVFVRFSLATLDCSSPITPAGLPQTARTYRGQRIAVPASVVPLSNFEAQPDSPEALVKVIANATSCQRTYFEAGDRYSPRATRPFGLFGLVRDRAPTCGPDLEDLQWIDADDTREAVLMILVPGEDSILFRRRLERIADTPATPSQQSA